MVVICSKDQSNSSPFTIAQNDFCNSYVMVLSSDFRVYRNYKCFTITNLIKNHYSYVNVQYVCTKLGIGIYIQNNVDSLELVSIIKGQVMICVKLVFYIHTISQKNQQIT